MLPHRGALQLGLLFSIAGVSDTFAQAEIPDFYQEPGVHSSREMSFDPLSRETIDPFSGVLRHQYVDLVVPGNGIDIVVTRTYHSKQRAPGVFGKPFLLGRTTTGVGWDIHFGRVYYDGTLTPGGCAIPLIGGQPLSSKNPAIELPDGTRKVVFTSLPGVSEEFMTKDRWVATCVPGVHNEGGRIHNDGGLEVRTPNGMKYTFDRLSRVKGAVGSDYAGSFAWHLTRMEDLNGNWIEVDYRDRTRAQYTEIERVRAKDGRVVDFTYTNAGSGGSLLTRIEAYGEVWNYEYEKLPGEALEYYYLKRVLGPESLRWAYDYFPSGDGLHSMEEARGPMGGQVNYTYQRVDLGAFPATSIDTTAVLTKKTSGPDVTPGTWTYRFYRESSDDFDYTEIEGPVSREVYRHCGMRALDFSTTDATATVCNAREGTLLQKDIYQLVPSRLVQTEVYDWGLSQVSAQWEKLPYRGYHTVGIFARRLHQTSISRDGDNYTTSFRGFDAYDNPSVVTEYSGPVLPYGTVPPPGGRRRDRAFTYVPDLANWLLHLVTNETMPDIPVITTTETRNMEFVTERTFDARGNVETETINRTNITKYTYYPDGQTETITDARNNVTRFLDYFRGVPRREERPESVVLLREVDFDGTVRNETNGRRFVTRYLYDDLDRVESIQTPRTDDADISLTYQFASGVVTGPASSNAQRTLNRGGFVEERILDGFGRIVQVNADGIYTTTRYDALGRKVFESYPSETAPTGSEPGISYEYDPLDRMLRMHHTVDGSFVEYEYSSGDQVKVTNERSEETIYTYRAFGDPDNRHLVAIDSPENTRTTFTLYHTGDPLTIAQGDATGPASDFLERHFVLDAQYQPDYAFHPEIGEVQFKYDALGNKLEENVETYPPTLFDYDGLNRLREVDYQYGLTNNVSYTYDENGNLKTLTKFPTTWTFEYDDNDNLTKQTLDYKWASLDRSFTLEYEYDERDAVSKLIYPSGLEVEYAPNARGWPTRVGRFATLVDYHPNGEVRSLDYANGHRTTIDLDDRLRPDRFLSGNSTLDVMDLDYDYDFIGNVTHIINDLDPLQNRRLEYDGADRLTVADGPWGAGSVEYDVFGNIRRKTMGATSIDYHYTTFGSLMTGVSGARNKSFAYDPAGNIVFDGTKIFSYGHDSNLQAVRDNFRGITLRGYDYDGFDRRVTETRHGSSETKFTIYDQSGNLLFELDPATCEQRDYIRLGSQLIARRDTDIELDGDLDGIPDCIELRWGLDPGDDTDAGGDLDTDGLTNLEEYLLGTDLRDPDTDGDGMDDKFEVDFGLKPSKNDAGDDKDLDGALNLHEYLAGTDPDDDTSIPPNGTTEWVFDDAAPSTSSLVIDGSGTTYIYGAARDLFAVDRFGQLVASRPATAPAPEMATRDGRLFAASSNFRESLLLDSDLDASAPIAISRRVPRGGAVAPSGELIVRHEDDIHVLDADGNLLWKRALPLGSSTRRGPVVGADGTIYVALFYGRIGAFDRFGNTKWWRTIPFREISAMVLGPNDTVVLASADRVYAFDSLGNELWTVTLGYGPLGLAVAADGTVYVVGGQAKVDIISPAGVLQTPWSVRPGATRDVAISADGAVFIVSGAGLFVDALESDGSPLWEYGDGTTIHPNLALTDLGSLIVPQANRVVSLKTGRAGPAAGAWAMRGANAARQASRPGCTTDDTDGDAIADCIERLEGLTVGTLDGLDDPDGDGVLNRDEVALGTSLHLRDTDSDHIPDGYEIQKGLDPVRRDSLGDKDGDGARNLHEFLLGTDVGLASSIPPAKSAERIGAIRREKSFPLGIQHLAIDREGNIYLNSGPTVHSVTELLDDRWNVDLGAVNGLALDDANVYVSDTSGRLHAIPLGGGTPVELFTAPGFNRKLTRVAIAGDGTLYVGSGNGSVYAVSDSGAGELYDVATALGVVAPPVVGKDGSVYVASRDENLYAFTPTLTKRWDFDVRRGVNSAPALLEDGTVAVVTDSDFVFAVTPSREKRWEYSRYTTVFGTQINAAPVVGADDTIVVQEEGFLRAITPNGRLEWEEPGGDRRAPVMTWDGRVIFADDEALVFINDDGTDRRDFPLDSRITAGPILARDGTVYVGTLDNRLIGVIAAEFGGLAVSTWPVEAKNLRASGLDSDIPNEPRRVPIAANTAPGVAISEPADGTAFVSGSPAGMRFSASSSDLEDGVLDEFIVWSSDIDGDFGTGATVTLGAATPNPELSVGAHVVTARVMDHNGATTTTNINLTVSSSANDPPSVSITAPADGTSVVEGTPLDFTGTASDAEDGDLTASIAWSSDRDGALGTGGSVRAVLSVGVHLVTAAVTDSDSAGGSASIRVEITAAASAPAELLSPVPGSTIDTSTQEFQWSSGVDATQFQLMVGTKPRNANIHSTGATTATSAVVSGIPQSGGTLYVTLYSLVSGSWEARDYTLLMGGTPVKAALTAPVTGTIVGESETFTWSPSNDSSQLYQFHVGTADGKQDVFASGLLNGDTSALVSSIPQSGGTIHIRLYSYLNNTWVYEAYDFTMSGAPEKATLTAPAAGTVVSESVTFEWSPSNDQSQFYQLHVGTADGKQDVFASGTLIGDTTALVSGIPQSGGTIHIRLYSYLNNTWVYEPYSFTMGGSPEKATLTAPVAGTTVSDSATFEWSPSNDLGQLYQLHIGTADGKQDVFASGTLSGDTTALVSGIPQSGGTIHIRLYSYLNNAWVYEAYSFATGGAAETARLIAPAAATVVGESVTFEWSPSNDPSGLYQLHIGTADGKQDVFASGTLSRDTSALVNGIPQSGGTIHIRLYSYLNNAWVYEPYSFTMGGTAEKAALTAPAVGTVLGESATFEWSPSNDLGRLYQLHVGTADGKQDIFASGTLNGDTTAFVSGIPQSGGTIYIRLYSYLNNAWVYEPYSFTMGGTAEKATLTAPAPGTVLGESATFEWSPSNDASQFYQLHVGTAKGKQDVFASGTLSGDTTALVSAIPKSGGTIHVRLYSYLNNTWVYESYSFTMGGAAEKATLTAPVIGTVLGESATFEWSPSNDASQFYQLHVGTADGKQDVFASGTLIGDTTALVSAIPQSGGTIHVRLYSYLNNTWVYEPYSFTMGGTPEKATLTSPAAGSVVGGTVAFEWTPSNDATQLYQLHVGTAPGKQDVHASGTLSATSALISGVPQDGSTLFVRIYSFLNNTWVYEEVTYVAGP